MRIILFAVALMLATASGMAAAHVTLERASPPVGGTVRTSPAEVSLRFNGDIEPAFSTLQVMDQAGRMVNVGKASTGQDRRTLRVALARLDPGRYRVRWRVVSVDTHVARGDFSFAVAP